MDLRLQQRIIAGGGIATAVVAGWQVAQGSFGLAGLAAGAGVLLLINMWLRLAPDAFVTGAVLVGYLVGNRGFAQLHAPNLPLLPAEAALGLGVICAAVRWARSKESPGRRDALNQLVGLWIILSAARLPIDLMHNGMVAVRDFALVYYAVFFFLAQGWAREPANFRWLENCLNLGLALVPPVFLAFDLAPEWFASHLLVLGTPLIYLKSDLAGAFMAAGVVWFVHQFLRHGRYLSLVLALCSLGGVGISNSRAAVVALLVGILALALLRVWRALWLVSGLTLVGLMFLCLHAVIVNRPLPSTPLYRAYESATSVFDTRGERVYQAAELQDKSDNNQFRLVWWRAVIDETWAEGRWLGLGFGHDLAAEFVRIYYADATEEFITRSPHNFALTVFGRTGFVGLVALLAVLGAVAMKTWQTGRRFAIAPSDNPALGLWLVAWAIFVSACLGVILEGPMGAVVFWIALGLANAKSAAVRVETEEPSPTDAEAVAASV